MKLKKEIFKICFVKLCGWEIKQNTLFDDISVNRHGISPIKHPDDVAKGTIM